MEDRPSGATRGVQGVISGAADGVSSVASTTKNAMEKFGRLLTGANRLAVEIPDRYLEAFQVNREETKEVAEKAAIEFLSGKSVKVEKLPKKSKGDFLKHQNKSNNLPNHKIISKHI